MVGDIVGVDGIAAGRHRCQATALEHTEVCALPLERLEHLSPAAISLPGNVCQFLARELARGHELISIHGMRAHERLVAFLLDLAEHHRRRGYAAPIPLLRAGRNGAWLDVERVRGVAAVLICAYTIKPLVCYFDLDKPNSQHARRFNPTDARWPSP